MRPTPPGSSERPMAQARSSPASGRVPSRRASKLVAQLAGTTGGLGVLVVTCLRVTALRGVPAEMWVALTALIITTTAVTALALTLEYKRKKLEIAAAVRAKELDVDLEKTRLNGYLDLQHRAASDPDHAQAYCHLIEVDALHQSVENGTQPTDQTHGQLYGTRASGLGAAALRSVPNPTSRPATRPPRRGSPGHGKR
jgi:hypothetical protein